MEDARCDEPGALRDAARRKAARLLRNPRLKVPRGRVFSAAERMAVAVHRERLAERLGMKLVPAILVAIEDQPKRSRTFSWLAILTPRRIWNEDVGDALETIEAMRRGGCSKLEVRAKIISTYFWVLIAVVRELVAALTGRKSPHK